MENIGHRIRIERTDKGITQSELASMLGITQDSVSLWEKGKRIPDTQYVISLCKIFEISADYLLGIEDDFSVKIAPTVIEAYSSEERQLIDEFRKLNPTCRKLIKDNITILSNSLGGD